MEAVLHIEIGVRSLRIVLKSEIPEVDWLQIDVAKRAGRVGFGLGQSGLQVKRVTG